MNKLTLAKKALIYLTRAINEKENNIKPADFDYNIWRALYYISLANENKEE